MLWYDVCWLNYNMPKGIDVEILRRREVVHVALTVMNRVGDVVEPMAVDCRMRTTA